MYASLAFSLYFLKIFLFSPLFSSYCLFFGHSISVFVQKTDNNSVKFLIRLFIIYKFLQKPFLVQKLLFYRISRQLYNKNIKKRRETL